MDFLSLAPMLITVLSTTTVAIVGWGAVHWLSGRRDRANKQRDLRVQYLIEAYRRLESACSRKDVADPGQQHKCNIESAIADVQLFGTARQIALTMQIIEAVGKTNFTDPRPLLADLRDDLRKELNLEHVSCQILHFRVTGPAPSGAERMPCGLGQKSV